MKKFVSVMLVALMLLGGVTTAFCAEGAAAPKDVAGTTYEEAVKALLEADVVSGYKDGTYRPANTLTRAEACAFLVNYLAPTAEELKAAPDSKFSDVTGWAVSYVNYAVEKGIVTGYKDGTFRPGNQVTYQEMAAMTVNALGIDAKTLTGSWPNNYVNKAKELGMYENISVSKANSAQANRGDVAEMIYSLIQNKDKDMEKVMAERLVKSQQAMADVKSLTMDMTMGIAMSAMGESMDIDADVQLDMIAEPLAMKMNMDMSMLGENVKAEYYYVTEGDDLVMYMQVDGEWYKMAFDDMATLTKSQDMVSSMEAYLKAYDNVRIEGRDTVNGKPATKFYGELNGEYIDEVAAAMEGIMGGALGQGSTEATEEMSALIKQVMEMMKGMGYEVWIDDASGQMVKIRMDLSDLMAKVFAEIVKSDSSSDAEVAAMLKEVKISDCIVELTIKNVNNVKEIKLPEAAKNAADMSTLSDVE